MTERIDTHHHFWRYRREQYPWMTDRMQELRRDFLPPDLASEMRAAQIDGVISVQARQSLEETAWLLQHAASQNWIRGVVGWASLGGADIEEQLERLQPYGKLKGFRHVVHDEPDDNFILREDFNRGITRMLGTGLIYEILIYERH